MSALLNSAGRRLFARHVAQYAPQDPMYESYTDARGRTKRRRRALPPGLSPADAKLLAAVQRRAHRLDRGFALCGLRFGWTFVLGLVPGLGDAADAALGYLLIIRKAREAGLPPWLVQRMLLHLALATSAGLVPLLGDVLLAAYKPNSRNAALLEEFLRLRGEKNLADADASSAAGGAEKIAGGEGGGKGKGGNGNGKKGEAKKAIAAGEKEKPSKASPSPPPTAAAAGAGIATATATDARPARSSGSGRSGRWAWRRGSKSSRKGKGEKGEAGEAEGEGAGAGARGSRFVEGDVMGGEEAGGGKAA